MTPIGIVAESVSSLKILGDFIVQASRHDVFFRIFIPETPEGKSYDDLSIELLLWAFPQLHKRDIFLYKAGGLVKATHEAGVGHLLLLNPYRNFAADVLELAKSGVDVYGLDYFANSAYVAASEDDPAIIQQSLAALAGRFVTSDWWRDFEFAVQPEHKRWEHSFLPLGTPLIDSLPEIDTAEAREKLGLDDRPVVSLFTPNIRDHHTHLFYGLGTRFKLKRLAKLVRTYCDARGFQLVVKSREKQWDAEPFVDVADVFVQELPDQVHPSTSALLLAVSEVAIHFGSMMVMEAAACGVPSIAISPLSIDKLHKYMRPAARRVAKDWVLAPEPESLFKFGVVSDSFDITVQAEKFGLRVDHMIQARTQSRPEYGAFNKKFSGWREGSTAAERIIQHLQTQSGETASAPALELVGAA